MVLPFLDTMDAEDTAMPVDWDGCFGSEISMTVEFNVHDNQNCNRSIINHHMKHSV